MSLQRLLGFLLVLTLLTGCSLGAAPVAPTATSASATAAALPATAPPPTPTTAPAPVPATIVPATTVPGTPPPGTRTVPAVTSAATSPATPAAPAAGSPAARATVTSGARSANNAGAAPNTTPAAGAALIEQAVGYLLDQYVDPPQSSELYQAAYDGAVATLRASGKAPQPQTLALGGERKGDAASFKAAYLALANGAGADINQTVLAYEAIRTVTEKIDECHTAFLDPSQYRSVTAGLAGTNTFGGIGVTIRTQNRPATIGDIFPDTPAARSGLRPGDAIVRVGETDVSDLSADAISPLVRGEIGTQVTLTIQRPGEAAPRRITLTRAAITVPVFLTNLLPGPNGTKVGYMKLYSFSTGTDTQIQDALAQFERDGVTGWVLDLRDNGGGYIDILSKIASRFTKGNQPIAYRIERGGAEEIIGTDPSLYFSQQHPFAILINGGSASASEALASAATDTGFARVFGQKTAGCLAGATTYRLADGAAMQVTIWKLLSPQRREVNRVGQQPDEAIQPDPTGMTDPVLERAIAWLATQPAR